MISKDREYRDMTLAAIEAKQDEEDQAEERKVVEGYATTFDAPYVLYEDEDLVFLEQVDAKAFENTDMNDVIMQYNHEGRVFARQSNGTLEVRVDDKGLFISADLGGTEIGRELFEEIRGGYTNKMSFGFKVDGEDWDEQRKDGEKDRVLRTITSVSKLYDVSAVSIPANDATSISVRELSDGVIRRAEAERLKAHELEINRIRAEIRARAINGGKKHD